MGSGKSAQHRLVGGYAAARHWVVSREELLELGLSCPTIQSWLISGRLVPLLKAVYGYGRDIETPESARRAALLAAGPGAVLAGRSACEFWGMVPADGQIPRRIRVACRRKTATTLTGRSPAFARTRVEIVHRDLDPAEICRRDGFAITTPARALVDLSAESTPTDVKYAFLEGCRLGYFRRSDVDYCFRRIHCRRGAKALRPMLALWVPQLGRIRSVAEGALLLAWVAADPRMPRVNEVVHGHEVDLYWPDHGLVFEVDGKAYHGNPAARARDAARDRHLRARGLTVVRFEGAQALERPNQIVAEGRRMLDAIEGNLPRETEDRPSPRD